MKLFEMIEFKCIILIILKKKKIEFKYILYKILPKKRLNINNLIYWILLQKGRYIKLKINIDMCNNFLVFQAIGWKTTFSPGLKIQY